MVPRPEPRRYPASLGRLRPPERQHNGSNHDGGSTNILPVQPASVGLSAARVAPVSTRYRGTDNRESVTSRVRAASDKQSEESQCTGVWLCGGE